MIRVQTRNEAGWSPESEPFAFSTSHIGEQLGPRLIETVDPISTKNLQQVLELVVQPAGARITCCNRWFSPLLDITPISSSLLDIGVFGAGDKRTSDSISTPATTTTYIHNRLLPSALSPLPLKINNNKMPSEKFLFSSKSDFPLRYRLTLPW